MPASFAVLFALLVAIPGVLIPLYVINRMRHQPLREGRNGADQMIAGGIVAAMVVLMAFSVYAAHSVYTGLIALTSS